MTCVLLGYLLVINYHLAVWCLSKVIIFIRKCDPFYGLQDNLLLYLLLRLFY